MQRAVYGAALCAFTVLSISAPALGETFSLANALGVAYGTNPQLGSAQAALRATDEEVARADAGYRPTINASGQYGYEQLSLSGFGTLSAHPLQAQATISQPLFRGGRTVAEISRAKALVRQGRAQLTGTEQTVLLDAVTAYMDVVQNAVTVKLRQNNVDVLARQKKATQEQFEAGGLTRTDTSQAQARLARAQADLTTAQGQLTASRATFERVIGRPAETLEDRPALPKLPNSEEQALNVALAQNPAALSARENERATNFAIDDAVGALLPSISLQGQYLFSKSALNEFGIGNSIVGEKETQAQILGQINVPIYQGGAEEATVRQAKELHGQAQLDLINTQNQVREAVHSTWSTFLSAKATIDSNQETVKSDQVAFEGTQKEQQVGGRTVLDVLDAEQELLNAKLAVVVSQRNTIVAAYQLLASVGGLTAKALNLDVKPYDPLDHYNDDADRWIGLGN